MKQNSVILSVAMAIALLVAGFAIYERQEVQRYARTVRVDDLTAQSISLRDTRFDLSLLLSVEVFHLADDYRTRSLLLDSVQANPELVRYLHADIDPANSIAFSPDGKTLASGYFGGKIVLWDVATGKPLKQLLVKSNKHGLGSPFGLSFSPDGKVLVAGVYTMYADERIIALWNVATGQPLTQPLLENNAPDYLLFSPDGRRLAVAEFGKVRFWDVEAGKFVGEFPVPLFEALTGLNAFPDLSNPVFSPDGKIFAAITSFNEITLWDTSNFEPIGQPIIRSDPSSRYAIDRIVFSEDGRLLILFDENGRFSFLDLTSRQIIRQYEPLQTSNNLLSGYNVEFSRDARLMAITDGSVINVLDAQTGRSISQRLTGNVNEIGEMAFSLDGKMLASAADNGVILWDLAGRQPLSQALADHGGSSIAFSPDGKLLAADTYFDTNGWQLAVGLWNVSTQQLIAQLGSINNSAYAPVAFSPNGDILATGTGDGIAFWDVPTRKFLSQVSLAPDARVSSLAFSPDGKLLAIGSDLGVTFWDTAGGASDGPPLQAERGPAQSLAFSPDGKTLAAGGSNSVVLWDIRSRHFTKWSGDYHIVDGVAFSPDGKQLASTSRDRKIVLWNVKSQQAIGQSLIVPSHAIPTAVAFSPDGTTLVSGGYDGTIDLWDVATREPMGQGLIGNTWPVGQIAFSPDGNTLATTSDKITLWDTNPQSWAEKVCQRVGRNLTRSEWIHYLPGEAYRATCPQWPLEAEPTPTPAVTP